MPIDASTVTRGYADYQRLENWDSPILFSASDRSTVPSFSTPVLDVSRYAYIGGLLDVFATGQTCVIIAWYADPAALVRVAQREFTLLANMQNAAQLRVPNLGPFCRLTFLDLNSSGSAIDAEIFATNRYHPLEFIPQTAGVLYVINQPVAANASLIVYPTDYYAGPLSLWMGLASTTSNVHVQALDTGGTWQFLWRSAGSAADVFAVPVIPPGAWRIRYDSGVNATADVYITGTASMTGST